MTSPPAIAVDRLRVSRGGREILHGVSLDVPLGSITGLVGPSGGGKSTLMRSIVGVQIIDSGTVTVLGHEAGSRRLRDRVGYATQSPAVYADLTVAENLRYFAAVLGAPGTDIARVIEEVGLEGTERQLAGSLSNGQHSRASLAVALLGTPELLVLDEPTVGLDPVLRDHLWQLFGQLAGSGVTLLISSHVMDEAARCERILLIRDGYVLADDTPANLRSQTEAADLEQAFLRLVREQEAVS
jgi:ABC-2 type transport system ATP-binding protein